MAIARREKHHRFPLAVIELATSLYQRHNLTYREVSDLMIARGIDVSHKTVYEWVQKFGRTFKPSKKTLLAKTAAAIEEQYVRVNGEYKYLYRLIEKDGSTANVVLKSRKNLTSAKAFLKKPIRSLSL